MESSMEIPWNSRGKFHGKNPSNVYVEFHGIPWKIPWNSVEFHEIQWNSMEYHETEVDGIS
jgi:hypothetical protein